MSQRLSATASTESPVIRWPVVVLACGGADEGPLNVVRSLGLKGVDSILVAESPRTPAARSRYVRQLLVIPEFTRHPDKLLSAVVDVARACKGRPVVFPTADPDLLAASAIEQELRSICHLVAPPSELVAQLSDKRRFCQLARQLDLPVPRTYLLDSVETIRKMCAEVRMPVVIKPSLPKSWQRADVEEIVGTSAKALFVSSVDELEGLCCGLIELSPEFLVQEFIPGDDPEHVDVHAYFDRSSRPVAWFCGQKIRIFPPHAGSGSFVVSRFDRDAVEIALDVLQRIRFTGIANMNFKRSAETGQCWLLEINPRVSQWNILAARCGVNLPYLAYLDAIGVVLEQGIRQVDDVHYLNFRNDYHAFKIYRDEGAISTRQYFMSLLRRPMVFQMLDWRDPLPFLSSVAQRILARLGRIYLRRPVLPE